MEGHEPDLPVAKRPRAQVSGNNPAQVPSQAGGGALTVEEIAKDKLTKIAEGSWLSTVKDKPAFKPELVATIYNDELGGSSNSPPTLRRIMLLEISQYLEKYLLLNFDPATSTFEHVMSIILMINEKFREGVSPWRALHAHKEIFPDLFKRIITLRDSHEMKIHERTSYLVFAINVFQSLEDSMVRGAVLRLVSLPLWHALSPARLALELHAQPALAAHWKKAAKKEARAAGKPGYVEPRERPENRLLPSLLDELLQELGQVVVAEPGSTDAPMLDKQRLLYCERFVELLIDLLSQLPTRRFVHTLLEDRAVLVKLRLSDLHRHPSATLFRQLLDLFAFYMSFPINNHTGEPLSDDDITVAHYEKVCQLQRLCFKHVPSLRELALSHCGEATRRDRLKKHLAVLPPEQLRKLATTQLRLVAEEDPWLERKDFIKEVVLSTYETRPSQREMINQMPLYPSESILWDETQIPSTNFTGEGALALPKLNLQFLTPADYLLRNFHLFRLEAAYEIREDISDVLSRMGAYLDDDDLVKFAGWARMALPPKTFRITEVAKPKVGESHPATVTAEIVIDTSGVRSGHRAEWDELKQHDVMFLMAVRPQHPTNLALAQSAAEAEGRTLPPAEKYGLQYVRGVEVIEVRDEKGDLMNDFTGRVRREDWHPPNGSVRTITVALDPAQYQLDINAVAAGATGDVYATLNLLMRRKPKENNFKAVLESIRDLMNEDVILPTWLHDVFLGYGDPAAAQWREMPDELLLKTVDFKDTFLNAEHVKESFPQYDVVFAGHEEDGVDLRSGPDDAAARSGETSTSGQDHSLAPVVNSVTGVTIIPPKRLADSKVNGSSAVKQTTSKQNEPHPPFRITLPAKAELRDLPGGKMGGGLEGDEVAGTETGTVVPGPKPKLIVEAYKPPHPGPYPQDKPKQNTVQFTPVQVEAILSGVQPGLTMVVGPPGTGKTDTAVQIMNVLYHNFPGQRTLLITHSNQALNDLFQKILERDIPARYLLRLGMGEAELDSEADFSRVGRVNDCLARRLELLAQVERLARSLNLSEDVAYTCETSGYFWLMHVLSRWEKFIAAAGRVRTQPNAVESLFPFAEFFADAPGKLFSGKDFEADMEVARGCFRHLHTMFQELEEMRPFELLKGQADRVNYLLTKQARIVAMTCTHAALKRREFLSLAFKFDNLLMEEAGQILEVETFIPMMLQRQDVCDTGPEGAAGQGSAVVSRLRRIVLIGDHHQLPPVVKNQAFQKYSHLDQSLFTRFIRLGTPYVELNAQGRARPSIARLYNWRYRSLGDLPYVKAAPEFQLANPGFAHEFQFVDVPDFRGVGESAPLPYFYQNLGEAEYIVSVYMYMRLMGYPAAKISILTTYNGQKALIRDVVEQRCGKNTPFGFPHRIATVDKYQGQQNEYILLSLVRTHVVGHLRDVRRLVVAMSRGRLGLYIFGRQQLFANCYELQPTFKQLLERPTKLQVVHGESYGQTSRKLGDPVKVTTVESVDDMRYLLR